MVYECEKCEMRYQSHVIAMECFESFVTIYQLSQLLSLADSVLSTFLDQCQTAIPVEFVN